MDQGRYRNVERRRADHRMNLELAQEARLLQAQNLALGLSVLDIANASTPETGALRNQVIGSLAPGLQAAAAAQMRGGAATGQPGVTPSPGAAAAPPGGLLTGASGTAPGASGPLSPRVQAPQQPVQGPPPPPRLSVTTPTAAADTAQPGPSGRPSGMAKALPAGEWGYGSAETQQKAELAAAEGQAKLLSLDLARKAGMALQQHGDTVAADALRFFTKRFGTMAKALEADPKDFQSSLFEFKSELYGKGMDPQAVDAYLGDLTNAYAQQVDLRAKRIAADAKAPDDARQWLASQRQEQGAFKQHIAESLGLKFSIDPNFNVVLEGLTGNDPRLVAYNDLVDKYIGRVKIGESGMLVAQEAIRSAQGQNGGPQLNSGLRPYGPESVQSALDRGQPVSWLNGDQTVKDAETGRIYVVRKDGTVEDMTGEPPADTGESVDPVTTPKVTKKPDLARPQHAGGGVTRMGLGTAASDSAPLYNAPPAPPVMSDRTKNRWDRYERPK